MRYTGYNQSCSHNICTTTVVIVVVRDNCDMILVAKSAATPDYKGKDDTRKKYIK
jgi:hypothetical protein